ncbi:hypothetical protein ACFXI8_27110 [Streptomyces niveus]|uniref:hypothetical protein n=1 Tax=Streptomyces niveus TaxID=193462 RepID=UPI0036BBBDF7
MNSLPPSSLFRTMAEGFVVGAAAGGVFVGVWFAVTGSVPSLVPTVVGVNVLTALWGSWRTARLIRQWNAVLAAYERPVLGEGIETPHRPPVDDSESGGAL